MDPNFKYYDQNQYQESSLNSSPSSFRKISTKVIREFANAEHSQSGKLPIFFNNFDDSGSGKAFLH